jgi:mRNA interferase MazF
MIKRYELYWVGLNPTKGKEMQKTRPCVIVSPDEMNDILGTVIVAPLTSTIIDWPFRLGVSVKGKKSSMALDQIRTVTKERLGRKIGSLDGYEQRQTALLLQEMFAE